MRKKLLNLFFVGSVALLLHSCSASTRGISKQNIWYELGRNDMDVSEQKTATAEQTKILCIDFDRLFNKESGNFNASGYAGVDGAIPIVGSFINPTTVQNYALYNLLSQEPSWDFVVYPRFEQTSSGIPFFFMKTTAKVTARLGKIK